MKLNSEYKLKTLEESDISKLSDFFIKAYGRNTIFQSHGFLKWYFSVGKKEFCKSIMVKDNLGDIVSFYGVLLKPFNLNNKVVNISWGVNAFTLEKHRGKGFNSAIVDYLNNNNKINGVIGFTKKTLQFYSKNNYNTFQELKFQRFIYIVSKERTLKICKIINQDTNKLESLISLNKHRIVHSQDNNDVIRLNVNDLGNLETKFQAPNICTTIRNKETLKNRFLENPFIKYDVFTKIYSNTIESYVACREETLQPTGEKVLRIIDLFGKDDQLMTILSFIRKHAENNNYIYIDFSLFGQLYNDLLISAGFISLTDDDYCLLPQVTSPIEDRPNLEFLGLSSRAYMDEIGALSSKDVYFTRMDSDRDRLANINQLKT